MCFMKRIFAAVVALSISAVSHAGVVYKFESVTHGLTARTFAGTVKAEQNGVRVEVTSGDGMFFGDGSIVLSSPSRKTITVIDPSKRTFYELDLSNLLGRANGALSQFGNLVQLETKNPRVAVRDAGVAGSLEGFPVRRSHVVSSFDLVVTMFGEKSPARIEMNTDVWTTDKLPAEFANVMQSSPMRTGIDAIDKLIESQTASVKGFPLKQVTTTKVTLRGSSTTTTVTSRVSDVRQVSVPAAEFELPNGFRKVDSPVDSLFNQLR